MISLAYGPRHSPPAPRPTERFEQDPAAVICLTGELACGRDGACTSAQIGDVFAGPRLTRHCQEAVTGSAYTPSRCPRAHRALAAAAFLLAAIACDSLGDPDAIERAVGRGFDLTETGTTPFPSRQPTPGLPGHKARHRAAPTALICEAVDLLAQVGRPAPPSELARHCEPTQGETRVLRYLPSNLSAREIADELYLSMNTVKTHQRHLYRKLGARTRTQAVERARALGLLTPSSTTRADRATARAPSVFARAEGATNE